MLEAESTDLRAQRKTNGPKNLARDEIKPSRRKLHSVRAQRVLHMGGGGFVGAQMDAPFANRHHVLPPPIPSLGVIRVLESQCPKCSGRAKA